MDGSSYSGSSSHSSSSGKPYRRPGQRDAQVHNTIEKRRRAELSSNFTRLKLELPELPAKPSNVAILQAATSLIAELTAEEQQLLAALADERALNQHLRQQVGGEKKREKEKRRKEQQRGEKKRGAMFNPCTHLKPPFLFFLFFI
jgi:hypothetical protein